MGIPSDCSELKVCRQKLVETNNMHKAFWTLKVNVILWLCLKLISLGLTILYFLLGIICIITHDWCVFHKPYFKVIWNKILVMSMNLSIWYNVKNQLEIWTKLKLVLTNFKFQVNPAQLPIVTWASPSLNWSGPTKNLNLGRVNLKSFCFTTMILSWSSLISDWSRPN